jgi:hypothetical protein
MSKMLLSWTFLTFGTNKPRGVSMAIPMLCAPLWTTSVQSAFTWALRDGKSLHAIINHHIHASKSNTHSSQSQHEYHKIQHSILHAKPSRRPEPYHIPPTRKRPHTWPPPPTPDPRHTSSKPSRHQGIKPSSHQKKSNRKAMDVALIMNGM